MKIIKLKNWIKQYRDKGNFIHHSHGLQPLRLPAVLIRNGSIATWVREKDEIKESPLSVLMESIDDEQKYRGIYLESGKTIDVFGIMRGPNNIVSV